ncbi:hypothetical protein [Marinomonas ostreistagni]|uniref:Uncharacterized protein n=1 Tax=Marinomonas ostreistagni TaxID=359209 RepID=A0ABS0Z6D3_9GAMM|nr:hypothetical protein [Marinomonas ostreistagni]MBJ7549214.1 hypothetical protein [Marinomonas ostreistagni]
MERLKITLISLTITILTFMFGPLVLSALLYYAYTYCDDRPDKGFKMDGIYILLFISCLAPYVIALVAEQTYTQRDLYDFLRFVFSFKVVGFYEFNYDLKYVIYLIQSSTAHLLSLLFVLFFSIHVAKFRKEKYLGLRGGYNIKESEKKRTRIFCFLLLCLFLYFYYLFLPDSDISGVSFRVFGRLAFFHYFFFPLYIHISSLYFLSRKARSL